ncbi:hypothetical protein [Thermodesulfatator autotrophicus]|uniref:Uncharacterized protein n=1 Tax=Thermodesulfatator autotrophicus TaxID=1795632 RepID=A0A177EA66_9BACT|nr:hypothetical protein [Thermodesulfatator autotrophicus]OAG28411.1 hypothetical protein TH606_02195 [Thermodesulfatator autotrophicus]
MAKKAKRRDVFGALEAVHERAKKLKEEIEKLKEEALMELGKELLEARLKGQEMILPEELEAKLEMVKKAFSGELKRQRKPLRKREEEGKTEPEVSQISRDKKEPGEGIL